MEFKDIPLLKNLFRIHNHYHEGTMQVLTDLNGSINSTSHPDVFSYAKLQAKFILNSDEPIQIAAIRAIADGSLTSEGDVDSYCCKELVKEHLHSMYASDELQEEQVHSFFVFYELHL